jgi:hypothetical protein
LETPKRHLETNWPLATSQKDMETRLKGEKSNSKLKISSKITKSIIWLPNHIFFLMLSVAFRSFLNFSCMFLNPNHFSNLNSNCSNILEMRNLQEQVKKAFCYQELFWIFTVWLDCSSDLKNFPITRPIFSHSWSEQFRWQNTISLQAVVFNSSLSTQ